MVETGCFKLLISTPDLHGSHAFISWLTCLLTCSPVHFLSTCSPHWPSSLFPSSFLGLSPLTIIAGSSTASPPVRVTRQRIYSHGLRCATPGKLLAYMKLCLQLREWDLWQMSHSYVDVYFPGRAVAEAELGHLPFQLTSTSHRIHTDGGTSSCTQDPRAKHTPSCSPMDDATTRWDVASPSNATFHARYHPLDEIQSFVRDLAAAYPQQVAVVPLGHSGEGREMFALEISSVAGASAGARDGSHDQNSRQVVLDGKDGKGKEERGTGPRCGFLVTGAQHAREVSIVYILTSTLPFAWRFSKPGFTGLLLLL